METLTEEQNSYIKKGHSYNYETFFELSPNLLCIAGFDGYFKKVNHAVSRLLGYSTEEIYASPISDFLYYEDREMTRRIQNGVAKESPIYDFENRYVTKNGDIVWLSWTSMPISNEELIFAIGKNITDKKRMEEERNLLLTNLMKVNNNLKELTYTTSHDLRSPVNNLLFVFDLIDVSKIQDEETLNLISILKVASENLRETLNEYIDVFNHEDNLNMNIEILNLQESLDVVLRSIHSSVENSKAKINVDFTELPEINFNKAYLKSIFLNLVTNSLKYSRPNVLPVISVYSRRLNGKSQLVFEDNGLGLDMEKVKDKIFGLNQKFHNHRDSKGIGLYLVHNHISSLGGSIEVESKVGEGTRFLLTFKNGN